MGNLFKPKPPAPPRVDPAVKKAKEEADKKKFELERQEKSFDARKAKGMVGSRSLFGKAGGSGYLS